MAFSQFLPNTAAGRAMVAAADAAAQNGPGALTMAFPHAVALRLCTVVPQSGLCRH